MLHNVLVFAGGAGAASVLWAWWAISGGLRELHAGMAEGRFERMPPPAVATAVHPADVAYDEIERLRMEVGVAALYYYREILNAETAHDQGRPPPMSRDPLTAELTSVEDARHQLVHVTGLFAQEIDKSVVFAHPITTE